MADGGSARAARAGGDERSLAELLRDIVGNVQEIIRSEIRLARAELGDKARRMRRAGILLGAGAVIGLYALAFLLVSAYNAIALALPPWIAALIIGVVLGGAALGFLGAGRMRLRQVNPTPEDTVNQLKEDARWIKTRT